MTTPTLDEIIEKVTGALIMCIGECPEAYRVELDEALEEWAALYPEDWEALSTRDDAVGRILLTIETSATTRSFQLTPEVAQKIADSLIKKGGDDDAE